MQESAFVDPPWLLEREGAGYIQMTELLFRIAELCTGEHSVEDIAARISADGKPVNPITVRGLIAQLLIPRGLVRAGDGSVARVATAGPSPLTLNMRMKAIGPATIEPITTVLRVVFWPPILVAVLVIAATAQVWLYGIHGVGSSVHDAIYEPGWMPVIMLAIIVSAALHELGHATALHYAGGRAKSMGAGLYTVYPAFYTDVSDNYRLPRWSRVRTDLGGFYFNLLFGLGVMGLYLLTGQEFLLLIVVLINFEIIHQLLPFLRLDGYWVLADLTGVPDFFSQMGPFLRSVLPLPGWKGRKLPALKWWGRLMFTFYTLTTIPLLLLLIFLMTRSVPRVLATAWDSFRQQVQAFAQAQATGEPIGMAAAAAQVVFLALPTLGLCYTLAALARRLLIFVWHWSQPTPARRVVGSLAMLAVAGGVAVLWAPQLPFGGGAPGPLYDQARFEPIRPSERGTLPDAVAGVVATREPTTTRASRTPTPEPTAAATASESPAPDRAAGGQPARATPITTLAAASTLPTTPAPTTGASTAPTLAPTQARFVATVVTPAAQVASRAGTSTPTTRPTP
jgi:putative peptide zinc metalloprotease protein